MTSFAKNCVRSLFPAALLVGLALLGACSRDMNMEKSAASPAAREFNEEVSKNSEAPADAADTTAAGRRRPAGQAPR